MSNKTTLHVLLVHSDAAEAELVRQAYASRGGYEITHVTTLTEARRFLDDGHPIDLIIADWLLPDGRGADLPAIEVRGRAPVILLARNGNERLAVEAIQAGAAEYLTTSQATLSGLPAVGERVMREWSAQVGARASALARPVPAGSLQAVAELAIDLANAPALGDIPQLVTRKVRTLVGARATTLSRYDVEGGALVIEGLDLGQGLASRIHHLLGGNAVGMRIPISAEQRDWMLSLKSGRSQSLSELSWGAISPVVGQAIQSLLSLGEIHATVLQHEGELIGTLVVYMPRGAPTLPDEMMNAIGHITSVALRRAQAEERSRGSEDRYRQLVVNAPLGIITVNAHGRIEDANPAMLAILGVTTLDDAQEWNLLTSPDMMAAGVSADIAACLSSGNSLAAERTIERSRGSAMHLRYHVRPLRGANGSLTGLQAIVEDMSEYRQIEERLLQAQKMEAVGRLAGGVAHDFNNMLAVILGNTELALESVSPDQAIHMDLLEIQKAAQRSAELTQQLLAFARKQTISPKVLDLNDTVAGMLKLLQRLIGEDIRLVWLPGKHVWPVKMDPSQLDQVLANLAVNARDAINGVGRVTIETENVILDGAEVALQDEMTLGEYVRLTFSDDGCGMDKETLRRLFEPFFTTKEVGKGTGLGLATVYGIIQQNGGSVRVYSEPGLGSTFRVYLPRFVSQSEEPPPGAEAIRAPRGSETILLVEDEPQILAMGIRMLRSLGYTVLGAGGPAEAMRLAETHTGMIHLLVTDVVMPDMNGRDLAKELTERHPALKCLFMSGYTADVIAHHGVLEEDVSFIQKPYGIRELAAKVREVLD